MKNYINILIAVILTVSNTVYSQPLRIFDKDDRFDWIQTARVFLIFLLQP